MLKHWWIEYWWILAVLAYIILLVVLVRSGTWARSGPKIVLAIDCVLILLIPTMHSPGSYVTAALVVLSLLILFRTVFKSEISSRSSDR